MKDLMLLLISSLLLLPACCAQKQLPECSTCDVVAREHILVKPETTVVQECCDCDAAVIESGPEMEMPDAEKRAQFIDDIAYPEEESADIVLDIEEPQSSSDSQALEDSYEIEK